VWAERVRRQAGRERVEAAGGPEAGVPVARGDSPRRCAVGPRRGPIPGIRRHPALTGGTDDRFASSVGIFPLAKHDRVEKPMWGRLATCAAVGYRRRSAAKAAGADCQSAAGYQPAPQNLVRQPTPAQFFMGFRGPKAHSNRVDGCVLATAGRDKTLNDDPLVLRGHQQSVTSVAFSPRGRFLVPGSTDNTVRIWTLDLEELADRVCSKVSRNLSRE